MDDGVEALEVADLDVTDVLAHRRDVRDVRPEGARLEEIVVEAHHVVAGCVQQRQEGAPDVAVVAGDKYAHD